MIASNKSSPEGAAAWEGTRIRHVGDARTEGEAGAKRIAIVIGEFHNELMDQMMEDARETAESMGAKITEVVWVPGSYEAPLAATTLLAKADVDAVCLLGYIEKGSTLHGQEMGSTVSTLMKQLELEFSKPVGMGIIGPGATAEQAAERVFYAGNAVRAAIRMCHYLDFATAELDEEAENEQAAMLRDIENLADDDEDGPLYAPR